MVVIVVLAADVAQSVVGSNSNCSNSCISCRCSIISSR